MRLEPGSGTGTRHHRVHVHLDHGRSPETWAALHRRGERMTPTSYGYEHAAELVDLSFSADRPDSRARRFLRKLTRHYLGIDVVHVLGNRRSIAAADMVWTHTEFEWLSLALLMRLHLVPKRPLLAQSVWLWDDWDRLPPARRALGRLLIDDPACHVLQSRQNEAEAVRRSRRPVHFIPFGIAPLSPIPVRSQPDPQHLRVVAAGNDRDRDWQTLLDVAGLRPGWTFRILSGRTIVVPPELRNVEAELHARPSRILESFAWADLLVTPVRPNLHASGITIALEALSGGVRQVLTDTGGLIDYLGGVVQFAPPSDAAALAEFIEAALVKEVAPPETMMIRGLTDRDYALRLAKLTTALLEGRPAPTSIAQFVPQ